jgi:hypothetical protein
MLPQRPSTLLACLSEDESRVTLSAGSARIADAAELNIEVFLGHETHLELA